MLHFRQPRCVLVYALAPEGMGAAEANHRFNDFVADKSLPLVLFHDHFIGQAGGLAIFFVDGDAERDALASSNALEDWQVHMHPLIFARNPAAFDEQIAFTLRAYRGANWEQLQHEERPTYGDPRREAETAAESD